MSKEFIQIVLPILMMYIEQLKDLVIDIDLDKDIEEIDQAITEIAEQYPALEKEKAP